MVFQRAWHPSLISWVSSFTSVRLQLIFDSNVWNNRLTVLLNINFLCNFPSERWIAECSLVCLFRVFFMNKFMCIFIKQMSESFTANWAAVSLYFILKNENKEQSKCYSFHVIANILGIESFWCDLREPRQYAFEGHAIVWMFSNKCGILLSVHHCDFSYAMPIVTWLWTAFRNICTDDFDSASKWKTTKWKNHPKNGRKLLQFKGWLTCFNICATRRYLFVNVFLHCTHWNADDDSLCIWQCSINAVLFLETTAHNAPFRSVSIWFVLWVRSWCWNVDKKDARNCVRIKKRIDYFCSFSQENQFDARTFCHIPNIHAVFLLLVPMMLIRAYFPKFLLWNKNKHIKRYPTELPIPIITSVQAVWFRVSQFVRHRCQGLAFAMPYHCLRAMCVNNLRASLLSHTAHHNRWLTSNTPRRCNCLRRRHFDLKQYFARTFSWKSEADSRNIATLSQPNFLDNSPLRYCKWSRFVSPLFLSFVNINCRTPLLVNQYNYISRASR